MGLRVTKFYLHSTYVYVLRLIKFDLMILIVIAGDRCWIAVKFPFMLVYHIYYLSSTHMVGGANKLCSPMISVILARFTLVRWVFRG